MELPATLLDPKEDWTDDPAAASTDVDARKLAAIYGRGAPHVRRKFRLKCYRCGSNEIEYRVRANEHCSVGAEPICSFMIRWPLSGLLLRRSPEVRREAAVLVTVHGAKGSGSKRASGRGAAVRSERREADYQRQQRYWTAVMREINRGSFERTAVTHPRRTFHISI